MRKRWLGVVLLIFLSLGGVVGWHLGQQSLLNQGPTPEFFIEPTPTGQLSIKSLEVPEVSRDRLLSDVQALAFPRFEEVARDRARQYVVTALKQAGWTPQLQPFEGGINIVAERPGTDAAAGTILLGAHYDTVERSPGADDNATSVASVLEAARLLKNSTPRSLQLVLFDQEETGLLGSTAFVEQRSSTNRLQGAVILDMLGYSCNEPGCQTYPSVLPVQPPTDQGNFIAAIGDQGHPSLINAFSQAQTADSSPVLTLAIPLLGPLTPDLLRSDHTPFWRKGIGAVLVTDTANFRNPHYHQPSDTLETLDLDFFCGTAQTVIRAVAQLLNASQ